MSKLNKLLSNVGTYIVNSQLQGYVLSIDPEFDELINNKTLIIKSNETSNINRDGKVKTNLTLLICSIRTDDYKVESDELKDFQEKLMLQFNNKDALKNMSDDIVKVDNIVSERNIKNTYSYVKLSFDIQYYLKDESLKTRQ